MYPPRVAEFTYSHPKARINTTTRSRTRMTERTGTQLESSYVGDQAYGNRTDVVSSLQNITQRYIPPPIISDGCNVPIHAQPSCNNVHSIDIMHSLTYDLFRKVSKGMSEMYGLCYKPTSVGAYRFSGTSRECRL